MERRYVRARAFLVLLEEDPPALARAEAAAAAAGLAPFAAPDILNAFFVRVMQAP